MHVRSDAGNQSRVNPAPRRGCDVKLLMQMGTVCQEDADRS